MCRGDRFDCSLKLTWANLLNRERRNLKSNINSVAKCFMINRLIAECLTDPYKFARATGELYEEIKRRMSSSVTTTWVTYIHRSVQVRIFLFPDSTGFLW